MVSWELVYTKQAQKDAKKLTSSNLRDKAQALLDIIQIDPFQNPPPYERLVEIWKVHTHGELTFSIV